MREILVIRLSALGDVAMTLPAIYSCAQTWPDVRLRVVTTAFCAQLFSPRAVPAIATCGEAARRVEVVAVKPGEAKGLAGTLRLLRRLHRMPRPDAVADLHNVLRSWVIDWSFRLRGCRVEMVDKERRKRHAVLHRQAQATPFTQRYAAVFERLGLPIPENIAWVSTHAAVTAAPLRIGIAPFARFANKTYPEDKMRRVCQLLRQQGHELFLFGSRGEEAQRLTQWAAGDDKQHVVAGKGSLTDELQLMASLDVMVAMDSANHHLASLAGTRTVSIWGSTTPACGFMAHGQRSGDALVAHVHCQPCTISGSNNCHEGSLLCMNSLSPEQVVQKVVQ